MHTHLSRHFTDTPCPDSPPNAVEGDLHQPAEPVTFNDRPYFRRLLDFDDFVRRGRPVTCDSFAARWGTSTKTVQRFVDQIRGDFGAGYHQFPAVRDIPADLSRRSSLREDQGDRMPTCWTIFMWFLTHPAARSPLATT